MTKLNKNITIGNNDVVLLDEEGIIDASEGLVQHAPISATQQLPVHDELFLLKRQLTAPYCSRKVCDFFLGHSLYHSNTQLEGSWRVLFLSLGKSTNTRHSLRILK